MTLEEKRKAYGIPAIPYLPAGKRCIVWRLPPEEKTSAGLFIPAAHETVKSRGILLAAGLAARDILHDSIIEIGDEVLFGRFAGIEREIERPESATQAKIIEMAVEDIGGSVEAIARLASDYTIEYDEENGEHRYEPRKPSTRKKASTRCPCHEPM